MASPVESHSSFLSVQNTPASQSSAMQSNLVDSPPWDSATLSKRCEQINKKQGSREKEYIELLTEVKNAVFSRSLLDFKLLGENFKLINKKIPRELKLRVRIIKTRKEIKDGFVFIDYLNRINSIKMKLKDAHSLREVEELGMELAPFIKRQESLEKIHPLLNSEITKCNGLQLSKLFLLRFNESTSPNRSDSSAAASSEISGMGRRQQRRFYPILSIDGGGIRGIIPAKMLVEIEKVTGDHIASLFDLIGGTSTGGILALGASTPHIDGSMRPQFTSQDLLDIYCNQHAKIFVANPKYPPQTSGLSWGKQALAYIQEPKYQSPAVFDQYFQGRQVSSALTDVLITTCTAHDIINAIGDIGGLPFGGTLTKKVHLCTKEGLKILEYKNHDIVPPDMRFASSLPRSSDITRRFLIQKISDVGLHMATVAQVTSAAPTFFPQVKLFPDREGLFLDGGIIQNNPAIPCVCEALSKGIPREKLFMVSLGTGESLNETLQPDLSSIACSLWFKMTQPSMETEDALNTIFSHGAYHRFQCDLSGLETALDDTNSIGMLIQKGDELVKENEDYIREICRVLKPDL